jgi:hypothetical protein
VDLILASGNQRLIDRLLVQRASGSYRLNTSHATGFNAGRTVSGDRTSSAQQLGVEGARTNQLDGTMERMNRGMSKPVVEVDIGNNTTIPVERYTARELELAGDLPAGSGDLPSRPGWTRAELDGHLANISSPNASTPHVTAPHASTPHVTTPHVSTPRAPKTPKGKGLIGVIIAVGVLLYTGDAYAAAQTANPAADTTDAIVQGGGVGEVAAGAALDIVSLIPAVAIVRLGAELNRMAMDASHFGVPEGWVEEKVAEGRNPFCAICHGEGNLRERDPFSTNFPTTNFPIADLAFAQEPPTTEISDEDRRRVLEFINGLSTE